MIERLVSLLASRQEDEKPEKSTRKRDERQLKQLIYLLYMAKFYSMSAHAVNKVCSGPDEPEEEPEKDKAATSKRKPNVIPVGICRHFASIFCERTADGVYVRSERSRDANLCYLLVLVLLLTGSSAEKAATSLVVSGENVGVLAKDLSIARKKVVAAFKEVGARSDGGKAGAGKIVLSLPLKFPEVSRRS